MATRIGTIRIKRTTEFRTTEQTACNYRRIEVAGDQVAEIYIDRSHGSPMLQWVWQGVCLESHFVNRVFGSSSLAEDREKGQKMLHHESRYAYQLIELLHDHRYGIVLDESVTVTARVEVLQRGSEWAHTSVFAEIDEKLAAVR